jgi:DNA-binding CsgD family transcriptional regulator
MTAPTASGRPPYVVLPVPGDLDRAAADLTRRGWQVLRGFAPGEQPWDLAPGRVVAVGAVTGRAEAEAALLCAVRGAGLVVTLDRGGSWAAGFLADLERLAPPPATAAPPAAEPAAVTLTAEQRDLLELLAEGHSIAEAARLRYLSLRTANRRVAQAREALGVPTTREAVLAYVRLHRQ